MERGEKYECEIKDFKSIQPVLIVLIAIASALQLFITGVTIKFILRFKCRKQVFVLFMICINISLA